MDFFGLHGWTKTVLINFQNERLLVYFLSFLLGALSCKFKVFESEWKNNKLDIVLHCTGWIPINLYIFLLIYSLVNPGNYLVSRIIDTLALRLNFVLSLAYLLYAMVTAFRRYLNKQGRISQTLNNNSYFVYLIHVVVMGGLALTMLNTEIPASLKLVLLTIGTFGVSNVIAGFYWKMAESKVLIKTVEVITMKPAVTAILIAMLLTTTGYAKQKGTGRGNRVPHISLHTAALQGNLKAVQLHINAGSDLNSKDGYGSTPLVVAVTFGRTKVAKALINAEVDMETTNNEGSAPLHIAAFFCRTEIVKLLLDNGANKNTKNNAGRTPLDTVLSPFEDVKGIYEYYAKTLGPLGLKLDYAVIKKTRPRIVEMLSLDD